MRSISLRLFLLAVVWAAGVSGASESEAVQALINSWGSFAGFDATTYCNTSSYISCNGNGKVASLVFHANMLNGTIPSQITSFGELERLDLSFNNLFGSIPSLSTLSKLTYIDLQRNAFEQALVSTNFPASVVSLYLSYNFVYGTIPADFLTALPSLATFAIRGTNLTCPVPQQFISDITARSGFVGDLSQTALDLAGAKLCGQYSEIPHKLFIAPAIDSRTAMSPSTAMATYGNVHVRMDGHRIISAAHNSTTQRVYSDEYIGADFYGFTEQAADGTMIKETWLPDFKPVALPSPRIGFVSVVTLSNNVNFTLTMELNVPGHETKAKFSFDLDGAWPYEAPDSVLILQAQSFIVAPNSEFNGAEFPQSGREILGCPLPVMCTSNVMNTTVGQENVGDSVEIIYNAYTLKSHLYAAFPLECTIDGNQGQLSVAILPPNIVPIGSTSPIKRMLQGGKPFPFPKADGSQQILSSTLSLNLGRYQSRFSYDPTLQVTRLFDFGSTEGPSTFEDPTVVPIAVGVSIGGVVIIAAIVVIVVLKNPKLRRKLLPYSTRARGALELARKDDTTPTNSPSTTWESSGNLKSMEIRNTRD